MTQTSTKRYGRPILVTGGAGYIGSHTCKMLAKAGYTPITFDSMARGHQEAVLWGPLEKGDLLDRDTIDAAIRKHKPIGILHFAAWVEVNESVLNPAKYYRNNTLGSLNLLESAAANGIPHFIFSSTAAVYGEPDRTEISEDYPTGPINPYGSSKLMTEQMLADLCKATPLHAVVLRYFNASGADPDCEVGSYHKDPSHLIPRVLEAILGKRDALTIFGTDYPTRDGTAIRDYIHVTDLADAHIRALEYLQKKAPAGNATGSVETFNLGNGQGFSVKEVIATAEKITGKKVPVKLGGRRAGDPAGLVADASRARKALGWKTQHSAIETVVETAWKWMLKRG